MIITLCLSINTAHAQTNAIQKDSTDYGMFYIDTVASVFVMLGKPTTEEQEIFLEDILLSSDDASIDSTNFLISIIVNGEVMPETYLLQQTLREVQGYMTPTLAIFDVTPSVYVHGVAFLGSNTIHRLRIINVQVDVSSKEQ